MWVMQNDVYCQYALSVKYHKDLLSFCLVYSIAGSDIYMVQALLQ